MLYAGNLPVFVVDAYTKRLCSRLPINVNNSYDDIQSYFEKELFKFYSKKEIVKVFNKLHAQIVILAKNHCKKRPICNGCPLKKICKFGKTN